LKNKKIVAVSIIAAAVIGVSIFYIEKKAVTYKPTTNVYIATKQINPGTPLDKSNCKVETIQVSIISTGSNLTPKDNESKTKKIAKETIYKGEIINKNRVINKDDPQAAAITLKKDEVEFSINAQLLDNYAGTYREGDMVTIIYTPNATNTNPNPKSTVLIPQIKVLGAIDSQGKFLKPGDKDALAAGLSFSGTNEDMKAVAQAQSAGTFKIGRLNPNK
jgi:Flp pilus assembly protein CpaB